MRRRHQACIEKQAVTKPADSKSVASFEVPTHFKTVADLFAVISDFLPLTDLLNLMCVSHKAYSGITEYGKTYNLIYAKNKERLNALYFVFLELPRKRNINADELKAGKITYYLQLSVYFSFLSVATMDEHNEFVFSLPHQDEHDAPFLNAEAFAAHYIKHRDGVAGLSDFLLSLTEAGAIESVKERASREYAKRYGVYALEYCANKYLDVVCIFGLLMGARLYVPLILYMLFNVDTHDYFVLPVRFVQSFNFPGWNIQTVLYGILSFAAAIFSNRNIQIPNVTPLWNKPVAVIEDRLVISPALFSALRGDTDKKRIVPLLQPDLDEQSNCMVMPAS